MNIKELLTCIVVTVMVFLLCISCEESDSYIESAEFYIKPSNVEMKYEDETVALSVYGGTEPFRWGVSDETLGSVTWDERVVTYKRTAASGANIVYVYDSKGWKASALIIRRGEVEDLNIIPDNVTVKHGEPVLLRCTGGVPPYYWAIYSGHGKLSPTTGDKTVYTTSVLFSNVTDVIQVKDSEGNKSFSTINIE